MKKIMATLSLACLLLAGCNSTAPSSEVDMSGPPTSSEIQTPGTSANFDVEQNPYNAQTTITDDYIFVTVKGAIYRIDRQSGDSQVFISEETHDVLVGYSVQGIAAHDEALYFLSPNHLLDRTSTTFDTFELRLFRADIHDGSIEQIGVIGNAVYTLHCLEGFLVAHHASDLLGYSGMQEMDKDDAFKIFIPDAEASILEERVYSSLNAETQSSIERFIYAYRDSAILEERLYGGSIEEPFGPVIRANDAYYFLEFMSRRLYRVPLEEGDKEEVNLSSDAKSALQQDTQVELVNYDEDWLYFTELFRIFRIRKDGSEYQLLIKDGVDVNQPIDIVDGHIFYKGTDGAIYMDETAVAQASPESANFNSETLEATVTENAGRIIVRPDNEAECAILGERVDINPTGVEMLDDEGNAIHIGNLEVGARVTITYEGYYEWPEYTQLLDIYRIVLHTT